MPDILWILLGGFLPLASSYCLGCFALRKLRLPRTLALAAGAAILSHIIFLLMLAHVASVWSFLALGAVTIGLGAVARPLPPTPDDEALRLDRTTRIILSAVLSLFGILYLAHALAPEIRPDGYTYHLGLPLEWLRLGGFAGRVGFYEMLPQGLEMLFAFALAIGHHSAAKLVHFGFLAATVPLIFSVGRKLGVPPWAPATAAILYVCSPVVGTSGTASYNDAALVFYILATFYLAVVWQETQDDRYLLVAGLTAGFCYSLKFTGLIVAPLVISFAVIRRRPRAALLAAAAAALMIVPWMTRNLLWTRNPFAPLFNSIFPNPYFHVSTEQYLGRALRSYQGVTWATLPFELTVKGLRLQGLTGPAFLLAPLSLLGLRNRKVRVLLAAALLMAIPWFFNIGARFIMPSLVFLALALTMVLPRRLALACALAQAVLCLPPAVQLYADSGAWNLQGFPWRAALRLEADETYLRRELREYALAELVNRNVQGGERVLDLFGVPNAYVNATAIAPWHSAWGDRLGYALQIGTVLAPGVFCETNGQWPEEPLTGLRISQTGTSQEQWGVNEIQLFQGSGRIAIKPEWRRLAKPNRWEARYAFDGNLMSRWGTWAPLRPEMYIGIEFNEPVRLTSARAFFQAHEQRGEIVFEGRTPDGEWRRVFGPAKPTPMPLLNLRRSVNRLLRQEGVRFILAPIREEGYGPVARALAERPTDWGAKSLGEIGDVHLFQLQ